MTKTGTTLKPLLMRKQPVPRSKLLKMLGIHAILNV
jgi:hypothetical protein